MKLTKYWMAHSEFKFSIMLTKKYEAEHRRELIFTFPYREFALGFDW